MGTPFFQKIDFPQFVFRSWWWRVLSSTLVQNIPKVFNWVETRDYCESHSICMIYIIFIVITLFSELCSCTVYGERNVSSQDKGLLFMQVYV